MPWFGLIVAEAPPINAPQGVFRKGMLLRNANPPRDLLVALPIGALLRDARIVHRRLHIPRRIDGSRGDSMLARSRVLPLQGPDLPRKFSVLTAVDRCRHPRAPIDLHLHPLDGGTSGRADDAILPVFAGDLARR
jgi:hypothetical protein